MPGAAAPPFPSTSEHLMQKSILPNPVRLPLTILLFALLAAQTANADSNRKIVLGADAQIGKTVRYDPAYVSLKYPGGDVPIDRGVCTDVVVRALRHAGVDLQKEVHEDMKRAFKSYPQNWRLKRPDKNIDHRRVPNLMKYFERKKKSAPITRNGKDYRAGDIVAWRLGGGRLHIGIVSDRKSRDGKHPLVVHNIGGGARREDMLFQLSIIGHYRYFKK
jgi:uncharacterized protein YijF (DUF1287 family)